MNRLFTRCLATLALLLMITIPALAAPNAGTYQTTDLGGQLLNGRSSTWRPGINSGLPHVLHAQSWNGSTLGTQWELRCPIEANNFSAQNNLNGNGTGTIVYTSSFQGGQFELYNTGGPWGDGVANLGTTSVITTVQYVAYVPQFAVANANTSGDFGGGCTLTFAIGNAFGVGETTSSNLAIVKPADYPTFLDATCNPALANQQFGTWGNTLTSTMRIDCVVPAEPTSWGALKSHYR